MYETIRIVNKIKPKYVLWENVKNILSPRHKHNFEAYIQIMQELGYTSYFQVLNAKEYGIPQNRERVYTISIRNDIEKTFTFPEKEELKLRLKDMLEENVEEKYYLKDKQVSKIQTSNFVQEKNRIQEKEYCDTILSRDYKDPKCVRVGGMYGQATRWGLYDEKGIAPTLVAAMGEGGGYIPMVKRIGGIFDNEKEKHQAGSIYDKEGIAPTLDAMQGGWRQPSIIEKLPGAYGRDFGSKGKIEDEICSTLQAAMGNGGGNVPLVEDKIFINTNTKQGYEEATNGDSVNLAYPESKTRRGRVGKQVSQTITTNDTIGVVNNLRIRKLTPKECWRLMGFSDEDFNKAAQIPLSNTQLYKQAGNSIVVNVLEKIFENLFKEDR